MELLAAATVVTVVGLLAGRRGGGHARPEERQRDVLHQVATWVRGYPSTRGTRGTLEGVPIWFAHAVRGGDLAGAGENWTYVDCALPPGYPLSLLVRRSRPGDRRALRSGDMLHVDVGDPAFDAAFLVEAAPADVVRGILTAELRAFLMAQSEVELSTSPGQLRLALRSWLDDPEIAWQALCTAVRIAVRLRATILAADAAVAMVPPTGAPFRGIPGDAPLRAVRDARAAEVDRVEAVRGTRRARGGRP
ncbi:MAG: hypothetical protein H6708_04690 [Kofleriaceae bacterium]|nr:hypothetical protein [Kofleriaceae bacterium]